MLKIKSNVDLEKLDKEYQLDTEFIDGDYEMDVSGDREHSRSGVYISEVKKTIYGVDCSNLDLLYDLIKADLVEKI